MKKDTIIIAAIWFCFGSFGVLGNSLTEGLSPVGIAKVFASAFSIGFGMIISHMITKSSSDAQIQDLTAEIEKLKALVPKNTP